jgi:hypothetical protein
MLGKLYCCVKKKVLFFQRKKFFLQKELISFYLVYLKSTHFQLLHMSFIDLGLIFLFLLFLKKEENKRFSFWTEMS